MCTIRVAAGREVVWEAGAEWNSYKATHAEDFYTIVTHENWSQGLRRPTKSRKHQERGSLFVHLALKTTRIVSSFQAVRKTGAKELSWGSVSMCGPQIQLLSTPPDTWCHCRMVHLEIWRQPLSHIGLLNHVQTHAFDSVTVVRNNTAVNFGGTNDWLPAYMAKEIKTAFKARGFFMLWINHFSWTLVLILCNAGTFSLTLKLKPKIKLRT